MNPFEHLSPSELEELKRVFFTQSFEILEELQDAMLKMEADPTDQETLKVIQRLFHTLKGDSNSLGLNAVGSLCHRVEDVLTNLRDEEKVIDSDTVGLLLNCVDTIDYLLRLHESDSSRFFSLESQDNLVVLDLLNRIDAYLEDNHAYTGKAPPPAALLASPTEYQRLLMEKAQGEGNKVFQARVVFHPQCADRGVGAYMVGQKVSQWGEIISSSPELNGEEIERAPSFTVVFSARLDLEEIKKQLFISGVTGELLVTDYSVLPPPPAPAASAAEKKGLPEKRAGSAVAPVHRELMRIEASKVDKIMNLVGELIIGRSIVDQISKDLAEKRALDDLPARLSTVNAYMERNIAELQRGVMKMRMVPINHALRKFPKMVRDISAEKGKRVRLEIHGQETELDKSIVDAIGEPLAHIIRNCIDHGIDIPEKRRAEGKAEEGLITLRAYQEAAQIVIETADDGKGINLERLKQKAMEKGFFKLEEIEKLSRAEALNLIFFSGLTTSETLSETSGRGIGMDAVKAVLLNLKGTVEVESAPGEGTRFRLRLPLTLAVIKALLFEVGDKLYALPLAMIAEVTRVTREQLATIEGREALKLRDQVISIIDLHEIFKIEGDRQNKKFVLITGIGKNKAGLLVDRLRGQQELVVKAMDGQYTLSGLVAGASILGSGRVVLILDAVAIWREAIEQEKQKMRVH